MSVMGNEFSGLPIAELIGGPLMAACDAQVRLARATANFINTVGFYPELDATTHQPTGKMLPRQVDFSFWQPVPMSKFLKVTGVTITNGGSGYTTAPTVVFSTVSGGAAATGTAVVTDGKVTGITSLTGGSGYTSAPTITFTGAGTGATAVAMVEEDTSKSSAAEVQKVILSVPFLSIVNTPSLLIRSVDVIFDMEVKNSETHKDESSAEASLDATAKVGWGPFSVEVKIHGAISSHQENTRSTDRSAKYHVQVIARDDGMPEGLSRVFDILQKAIAPVSVGQSVPLSTAKIAQTMS